MPRTIVIVTLLPLLGIFTGCSTHDTTLGENEGNFRGGPGPTVEPEEDAGTGSGDPDGTCNAPFSFPLSVDSWWQAAWSPSLPAFQIDACWDAVSPAVVGVWTAPEDGDYYVRGWADFDAVISGGGRTCGWLGVPGMIGTGGCSQINAQTLPEPPWDVRAFRGSGFGTVEAKAGDRIFVWFHYRNANNAPPPDQGTVIANISRVPFL